jgi:hypothetical protein
VHNRSLPLGHPFRLIEHQRSVRQMLPTRQDIAIIVCGGGDPFVELAQAVATCASANKKFELFAGNDMIAEFSGDIDHALTLHPDKLSVCWTGPRRTKGYPLPGRVWAHRPYSGVSDWTRDWSGSTGLFAVKVARELGFVHILLCGVHMSEDSGHFIRKAPWVHANGFRRGWEMRLPQLRPYVRSFGGWTEQTFGRPTVEWLAGDIEDQHRQSEPPSYAQKGLKA